MNHPRADGRAGAAFSWPSPCRDGDGRWFAVFASIWASSRTLVLLLPALPSLPNFVTVHRTTSALRIPRLCSRTLLLGAPGRKISPSLGVLLSAFLHLCKSRLLLQGCKHRLVPSSPLGNKKKIPAVNLLLQNLLSWGGNSLASPCRALLTPDAPWRDLFHETHQVRGTSRGGNDRPALIQLFSSPLPLFSSLPSFGKQPLPRAGDTLCGVVLRHVSWATSLARRLVLPQK